MKGFKNNEKFEISKTKCEECESAQVTLQYSNKESPFAFFANKHTGCIYCDNEIRNLIDWPGGVMPGKRTEDSIISDAMQKKVEKKEKSEESMNVIVVSKKKKKKR